MGKSLINITDSFVSSLKMLNELMTEEWESEAEKEALSVEIIKSLAGDEASIATKVQNIESFLQSVKDNIARAREWKDDIDRQINVAKNIQTRLKEYVLFVLKGMQKQTGAKFVEGNGIRISFQAQGDKTPVIIDSEELVPYEYVDQKIEFEAPHTAFEALSQTLAGLGYVAKATEKWPNKDRIRNAINSGKEVTGAHIGPQAEGIRIRPSIGK